MKYILTILITLFAVQAIAQPTPTYTGSYTQMSYNRGSVGALRLQYIPRGFYPFPTFDTLGTIWVDSAQTRGLFYHNGTVRLRLASVPYVDSVAASIEAGSVDSSIYSTVTRLADSLHSLRDYVDSNNTIFASQIAELDSASITYYDKTAEAILGVTVLDSAVGVAFGAISELYDTLPNYVDTAQLNDSLQVIKAAYVPYTGATTDVNLGTHNLLTNSVRLSTSPTGTLTNVGQLYFDATNVTPAMPLNANVTLQIGQEEHVRARNNTGVQINDGQIVYINSAQGNNPTIALANADSVNTSEVIGVATENIAHNGTGFVTTYGTVNGINTSAFNVGDVLYLSATNGTITNVIPTPPHNVVKIGVALNSTNNGRIFVKPSQAIGQDTTFAAPYNSNKVAPTQRAIGTYVRKIVKDTASALRTAINTKGNGTVTSVATGFGATGGTITTTGTISVDSIALATRERVKKQIDSVAALSGGGGSPTTATSQQVLYKSGSDTLKGASRVLIDSTDGRLLLARNVDTSQVSVPYNGGTKIVGRNRMGMSALAIVDTVSIAAALQRAVNAQTISTMLPSVAATFNLAFTGGFTPVSGQLPAPSGTNAIVASAASSIQHLKLTKTVFTTGSGVNSACSLRVTSLAAYSGLVGGTTKFSRGGGRGTFTFSFPTYASTERIMVGYLSGLTDNFSGEPSAVIAGAGALMLIKESTDTTLFFYHKALNALPAAISKVNTGVVPNNEDVYRLTVYVSPTSTYYMQLEVLSTTGTRTIVINPTTNIQPPSSKFVSYQGVNNGSVGGNVSYGLIQMMEEIY